MRARRVRMIVMCTRNVMRFPPHLFSTYSSIIDKTKQNMKDNGALPALTPGAKVSKQNKLFLGRTLNRTKPK